MECSCAACIVACQRCPGELMPSDVVPIARYLGVTVGEFVHDSLEEALDTGALRPKRRAEDGACVFLKNQRCSIHSVKPFECREWDHTKTREDGAALRARLRRAWND